MESYKNSTKPTPTLTSTLLNCYFFAFERMSKLTVTGMQDTQTLYVYTLHVDGAFFHEEYFLLHFTTLSILDFHVVYFHRFLHEMINDKSDLCGH